MASERMPWGSLPYRVWPTIQHSATSAPGVRKRAPCSGSKPVDTLKRQRHGTCSVGIAAMINQDECQYERHACSETQDRPPSAGAVAELDRQVRDTVEALKLKVENLRLFLSWRK
jgi:hypothetical protein